MLQRVVACYHAVALNRNLLNHRCTCLDSIRAKCIVDFMRYLLCFELVKKNCSNSSILMVRNRAKLSLKQDLEIQTEICSSKLHTINAEICKKVREEVTK